MTQFMRRLKSRLSVFTSSFRNKLDIIGAGIDKISPDKAPRDEEAKSVMMERNHCVDELCVITADPRHASKTLDIEESRIQSLLSRRLLTQPKQPEKMSEQRF